MKRACIISVGNELLNGRGVDTNSRYLGEKLQNIGMPMVAGYTVGDDIKLIQEALKQIAKLDFVGDVRQCGMMAGIEIVRDKTSKESFDYDTCVDHGWSVADSAGVAEGDD